VTVPPEVIVRDDDPTPPYEQVRQQLAAAIRSGVLLTGQRLPPLRQLSADLGLAVGTVGRAYQELEAAGLVVSRRGAGTRVADQPRPIPDGVVTDELDVHARRFVRIAISLGVDQAEIQHAVVRALTQSPASQQL
jgi:GntR family transcriptional regulator